MLTNGEIQEIKSALDNYEAAKDSLFDRDDLVAGAAWDMSDILQALLENYS